MYKKLLEKYGSPLYVYDEKTLNEKCNDMALLQENLEKKLNSGVTVEMHYSTKANSNPAILSRVKKYKLSVDCMSPVEMAIDKLVGFSPSEILYVCNNIAAEEMKIVHENNILICLDSISQVETWGKMFPCTDIMVRINPGVVGVGHHDKVITSGKATKFGISEENIPLLIETAQRYNIKIIGVHQHLGSLFLNDKVSNYIAGVKSGLNIIRRYFKDVKIIDLGGGFGVPYQEDEKELDLYEFIQELYPVLNEFCDIYPMVRKFFFEPGRYIPCESGILIGTVNAVKHENGQYWIGTDLGMNQLVRPSMYDSYHRIEIETSAKAQEHIIANVCGNICESGDVLGKQRSVLKPNIGDTVIVYNAGAYGYSMASNYTGRTRPAEIMIDENGQDRLIRRRETLEDMLRNLIMS